MHRILTPHLLQVDLQLERLRHENAALKRLIERTNQPQADPPGARPLIFLATPPPTHLLTSCLPNAAGPQHGMAVSDTEAAMRHENAALKRRMEMIQQQMDAMKAAAGGGSEGAHAQIALVHSQLSAAQQGLAAVRAPSAWPPGQGSSEKCACTQPDKAIVSTWLHIMGRGTRRKGLF